MDLFNCSMLKNEYGLSCIENYLLYLLSHENQKWKYLFCDSYMQFRQVLELMSMGQHYSYFSGIQRLQNFGEEVGLVTLGYINEKEIPINEVVEEYFVMQVTEKFVEEEFNKKLWRNDHYIMCKFVGNDKFCYLNDTPAVVGVLTVEKMKEIYAGKIITLKCKHDSVNEEAFIKRCCEKVRTSEKTIIKREEGEFLQSFMVLRDAVGITKVLVKRMEAFVEMFAEATFVSEYHSFLYDYYVKIEYMRIRGTSFEIIADIVSEISEKDAIFRKKLLDCFLVKGEKDGERL